MNRETFTRIVRRELARRGETLSELAARLKQSPGAVSRQLSSEAEEVRPGVIHRYAQALGVSVDIFFEKELTEKLG